MNEIIAYEEDKNNVDKSFLTRIDRSVDIISLCGQFEVTRNFICNIIFLFSKLLTQMGPLNYNLLGENLCQIVQ